MSAPGILRLFCLQLACTTLFSERASAQDGQLDASFATNGVFTHTWGDPNDVFSKIEDLVVLPDNSTVLVGSVYETGTGTRAAIVRLTPSGAFDPMFSFDGRVLLTIEGNEDRAVLVNMLPDGRIVVAGTSYASGIRPGWAALFNADGTLDPGFGVNGVARFSAQGQPFKIQAMTITSNGRIALAGVTGNTATIMMINDDGELDPSFSFDGMVANAGIGNARAVASLAQQADGRLVVLVNLEDASTPHCALRYMPNGTLDLSFGQNGLALGSAALDAYDLRNLEVLSDGRLLITARDRSPTDPIDAVAVLTPSGQPDASVGMNGIRTITETSNLRIDKGVVLASDGDVFVSMQWIDGIVARPGLIRLTPQLDRDHSFGTDGIALCPQYPVILGASGYHRFTALRMHPDGHITAAGFAGFDSQDFWSAARFIHQSGTFIGDDANAPFAIHIAQDPAADAVRISFSDASAGRYTVQLFDARGALLPQSAVIHQNATLQNASIALHGLPNGMYVIVVEAAQGRRSTPFIIAHH